MLVILFLKVLYIKMKCNNVNITQFRFQAYLLLFIIYNKCMFKITFRIVDRKQFILQNAIFSLKHINLLLYFFF